MKKKLFDFAIGNPPYQGDVSGNQRNKMPPVYNNFMDGAYSVATSVELITPARFLFNAGDTPKEWNEKMLNDEHLKILMYEPDAQKVFPSTGFKGGVVITVRDASKHYSPIKAFTSYPELNSLLQKIERTENMVSFSTIIQNRGLYRFSREFYQDYPKAGDLLSDSRVFSGAFNRLDFAFSDVKPNDEYIGIYGLDNRTRTIKYIKKKYIVNVESLNKYKVLIPKANGSGAIGEVLSTPLIGEPLIGHTETFLTIGCFDTKNEAESCLKYVKTKFARTALGILKITQDNTAEKWKYVPMQDFTTSSDIDWSRPIHDIDQQLYKKYGLSNDEIEFIETHVKEMD